MDRSKSMRALTAIADALSGLLFFSMFIMFVIEVFFRYVLDAPISWSIEYIMVSFLLMMFWTLAFNVPLGRHVAFSVLRDALPPLGKRIFAIASYVIGLAIFGAAVPGLVNITIFEGSQSTPILHFPYSVLYGAFGLFIVTFALRLIGGILLLFRSDWREHV